MTVARARRTLRRRWWFDFTVSAFLLFVGIAVFAYGWNVMFGWPSTLCVLGAGAICLALRVLP